MCHPIEAGPALSAEAFRQFKRRAIFECCKWDPQVEDVCTLASFPLVMNPEAWEEVSDAAEAMAEELAAAEEELRQRPELHACLDLPRGIGKALRHPSGERGPGVRLLRFDFHFTEEGWRISECNTDVAGGYNEASGYTRLMSEWLPSLVPAGDPARSLARALARETPEGGTIGLVHATAFTDDRQVMVYLARELEQLGRAAILAAPDHLQWKDGRAFLDAEPGRPLDAIARFFPAEWLANLPRRSGWQNLLHGHRVPLCNPGTAILTQSKRFPLTWEKLAQDLPTWRRYLPETRDPRTAGWEKEPDKWVVKPAFGRVGELVGLSGVTTAKEWHSIRRSVRRHPGSWIAQRRFQIRSIDTPAGPMFPCLGIYTVDGRVSGIYGRLGRTPIIDHLAVDAPVFLATEYNSSSARSHRAPLTNTAT